MSKNNTIEIDDTIGNIQSQRYIMKNGKLILEIEYSFKVHGQFEFETKRFIVSSEEVEVEE